MAELHALYSQATKLILSIQDGLTKLEGTSVPLYGEASGLERDLHDRLLHLKRLSTELDTAFRVEAMKGNSSKQTLWKRKVEKVADDVDKLSQALDRHHGRVRRRQQEAEEREQLIGRRTHGAVQIELDEEAQVTSIANSRRVVAEAYETGMAILGQMAGQRDRLKAIQRRALDVVHRLGLSDSLLRVIDKRQKLDKVIMYGGMGCVGVTEGSYIPGFSDNVSSTGMVDMELMDIMDTSLLHTIPSLPRTVPVQPQACN